MRLFCPPLANLFPVLRLSSPTGYSECCVLLKDALNRSSQSEVTQDDMLSALSFSFISTMFTPHEPTVSHPLLREHHGFIQTDPFGCSFINLYDIARRSVNATTPRQKDPPLCGYDQ
ncbi:hypothetical protein EYF80_058230 [Liparis tanakae]|uniref:Uncharacterized protein n=1 Tax=Liparis tanakae TaxID=230148 RepID=A0A4Z2ESN9_9TELE|nr:hypothetical protein EYF80_058230 [Liparis tanakae]